MIDACETVFNATKLMVEHNIGSIIVTQDGKVRGIFTERDYLRKIVHNGKT